MDFFGYIFNNYDLVQEYLVKIKTIVKARALGKKFVIRIF